MTPPLWLRALGVTLATLVVASAVGLTTGLDRWLTDQHWRWKARATAAPFPQRILVVAVDDASVQELGRLSNWRRTLYARLLGTLRHADAVALDLVFAEPDTRYPEDDAAFSLAIREHGRVVLGFNQWKDLRPLGSAELGHIQDFQQRLDSAPDPSLWSALPPVNDAALQPPFAALLKAALALGSVDVEADGDGVHRRVALVRMTQSGKVLPHLALMTACAAEGVSLKEALAGAPDALSLGGRKVPAPDGVLLLQPSARSGSRYAQGEGAPVPTMSFHQALRADPEAFRDKIVLVGETAAGTTDVRPTPLDSGLRGVEFNAEIVANLLAVTPVAPLGAGAQWALVLVAAGAPLLLYSRFPPGRASFSAAAVLVLLLGAMELLFWTARLVPGWATVLTAFLAATVTMGLQRLAEEEAQKRRLRESFSRYVPPALVDQIVDEPELARQEGTRCRVAVLFSDIRGFTSYSEQQPPEVVVRQMRQYLDEMSGSVDQFRGVLDKFIGDEVMALFGPFLPEDANHSALAVACGLNMQDRLEQLNKLWMAEGLPPFKVGIGAHVGEAIVGNIGTARREQFTALGDTVNLGSRLQSATKELSAVFLVSEAVFQEGAPQLSALAEFIDRGEIAVRGKEQPVRVYEVRRASTRKEQPDGPR